MAPAAWQPDDLRERSGIDGSPTGGIGTGMTATLTPATGVLDLTAAATLLGVPQDALRTAAEHRLVPVTVLDEDAYTFTVDQITAIRTRQTADPQAVPATADQGCCIDRDPDGARIWCRKCAAAYCGLSPKTLANHVHRGTGPRVLGRLGSPRYRKSDLDEWLA